MEEECSRPCYKGRLCPGQADPALPSPWLTLAATSRGGPELLSRSRMQGWDAVR